MKKECLKYLVPALLLGAMPAIAGPNDFFGGTMPGGAPGQGGQSGPPSASNPPPMPGSNMPVGGDYSDDEKRMQRKYKANAAHAKELVARGESMMKRGEEKHNDKLYKRGKVLKEVGEKSLSDLQENNPFPDPKDKPRLK